MSVTIKAFPTGPDWQGEQGMDLRDWFAGQAISGILADPDSVGSTIELMTEAYRYADAAMIARVRFDSTETETKPRKENT